MKVVHVVRQFHPSIGGMEEVVLNVARQHQANSTDTVEVVTLDRVFTDPSAQLSAQDTHQGLPIRRIGYRGSSRLSAGAVGTGCDSFGRRCPSAPASTFFTTIWR